MPPTMALILAISIIKVSAVVFRMIKISSLRGAIFCHVDKIIQFLHDIDDITEGYQK
jgi:hypothetical protein